MCPKGMICNLPFNPLTPNGTINYWNYFSQNMSNLTCVQRQPPAPVYGKAPGDKCNQAADCASQQCDLEIRACKPSSQIGQQCSDSIQCPVGAYCNSQSKLCTQVLKEGSPCT